MNIIFRKTIPVLAAAAFALTAQAQGSADPRSEYQAVELSSLVPASRMPDGKRAIFAPRAVRFQATLQRMPEPQKSDYLKQVMGMMGVTSVGEVSQRIVLDYGGEKPLAAYVEDSAAKRIAQELKPGNTQEFYAFHVYNNRYGPALVIVSFSNEKGR